MSILNPSIQFLRGTSTAKANNSTEILAAGQPFYDTTNKKLYIGDGTTALGNLTAIGYDGNTTYSKATTSTLGLVKSAANRSTAITPTTGSTTSNRYYGVELDTDGTMFVNVPWTDTNTDTDTNYYHTTGSWSGLTYTATANGGAGELKFTIPTGISGTTVALGNHTHSDYANLSHIHASLTDGTYTATAPHKTGTIALTSDFSYSNGTLTLGF